MKALTVWQPWASLIMAGQKPYEFRHWPAPLSLVGQRIVIHAGARPMVRHEINDLYYRLRFDDAAGTALKPEAIDLIARLSEGMTGRGPAVPLPLGSGLGTVILGQPRKATALFGGAVADSDRIDRHVWAWPVSDPEPFEPWVPMRGAQGFWEWPE